MQAFVWCGAGPVARLARFPDFGFGFGTYDGLEIESDYIISSRIAFPIYSTLYSIIHMRILILMVRSSLFHSALFFSISFIP